MGISITNIEVWIAEFGMIQSIECLHPELQVHVLVDFGVLGERQIQIRLPWPAEDASR